jgi:type IV secretory pathway TraG/TraD family ATPase VirD4
MFPSIAHSFLFVDESYLLAVTCHVQCAFAPNRIETAEHLSKLTWQTTVVKEQVTTSGRGWSTNVSVQRTKYRALCSLPMKPCA